MKKVFSLMLLLATILTFTACSDDDEPDDAKLSTNSYTLYHDSAQLIEGTGIDDLTWDSENEFVATVEDGMVKGMFVGETIVRSTTKNLSFTAEVKPMYYTYEEPCLDFGASKASIKAKRGTPDSEDATSLMYETNNPNAPIELYVFQNGGLYTCGVACKVSIANELADFLLERYLPVKVDKDNYSATFTHCYGKISDPKIDYGVAMQYSSSLGGLLVAYTGVNGSKSKSRSTVEFSDAFESLESVLK